VEEAVRRDVDVGCHAHYHRVACHIAREGLCGGRVGWRARVGEGGRRGDFGHGGREGFLAGAALEFVACCWGLRDVWGGCEG
jgi:hypothetical protein